MADNTTLDAGSGGDTVAADEVTYSGDTTKVQIVRQAIVTGSEGSKTLREVGLQDDTAFVPGTDGVLMIGAEADDAAPDSVDEGDAGALRMSLNRSLHVRVRDDAGNERGLQIDTNGDIGVTNAGLTELAAAINSSEVDVNIKSSGATVAVSNAGLTELATAIVGSEMQVDVITSALPSGAASSAGQLADGHAVTVDNASGASAVNIQDGGNVITVDGTITEANSTAILADTAAIDTATAAIKTAVELQVYGAGTEAAAQRVTIATDSTGVLTVDGTITEANSAAILADTAAIDTATAAIKTATELQVYGAGTEAAAQRVTIATDSTGVLTVDGTVTANLAAGTNLIGNVGLSGARTSGGTTPFLDLDVDETAGGSAVKGSAGQVYWIHCMNLSTGLRYLHFYNGTSITVGTGMVLTFPIPTQGDTNGAGFTLSIPNGIAFSTGIIVSGSTARDATGSPGTNDLILNLGYA